MRISRDREQATIEYHDPTIATAHLKIGPQVHRMTDEEILLLFNRTVAAQIRTRDELGEYIAIELPAGSPQVEYHPGTVNQWSRRGGVLRCSIDEGGGDDGSLPVVRIDERDFSWDDFGKMLCTYAGWGMRIVFVPDDELEQTPKVVVQTPEK